MATLTHFSSFEDVLTCSICLISYLATMYIPLLYFCLRNVISDSSSFLERFTCRNEIEERLNFLVAVPYSGHSLTTVVPDDHTKFSN